MAPRLALVPVLAALALTVCAVAQADVTPFGAAPLNRPALGPRSYFSFALGRGVTKTDSFVVFNGAAHTAVFKVGPAYGVTAGNSGYGYTGAFSRCRFAACWIHGLPSSVTVPARGRKTVRFSVTVPAGTPDRQYLAGITIQPAKLPSAVRVGGNKKIGASATIIPQVNIGVAITVGVLANLRTKLVIAGVDSAAVGANERLLIRERNSGQRFLTATGTALCLHAQRRFTYPVVSQTILPGDAALLTVAAPGLPTGMSLRCTVNLNYAGSGSSRSVAAWRGPVKVAVPHPQKVIRTGPHTFTAVPKAHVPRWAIALIIGGSVLILLLLALIAVLFFRRPRSGAAAT